MDIFGHFRTLSDSPEDIFGQVWTLLVRTGQIPKSGLPEAGRRQCRALQDGLRKRPCQKGERRVGRSACRLPQVMTRPASKHRKNPLLIRSYSVRNSGFRSSVPIQTSDDRLSAGRLKMAPQAVENAQLPAENGAPALPAQACVWNPACSTRIAVSTTSSPAPCASRTKAPSRASKPTTTRT